jgi:glycosyltransferase involved in cell wall biosynthesis
VLICNWRDSRNPEGGGSEVYAERIARGLVEKGDEVTIFCASHEAAPDDEVRDGIRFARRGGKLSVYAHGVIGLLAGRFGPVDVVVDVQNGIPFFTRLATLRPVVVLVHHVHREQWPVVYPGVIGRVGWWIESRLAPRLYSRSQYVAVSAATRDELTRLGVHRDRIAVVHNATERVRTASGPKSAAPTICVVGRLVPHKQIEHAIDALMILRVEFPEIVLRVVGSGWWEDELRAYAERRGVSRHVSFHGFLDEAARDRVYAESWVQALPSLKEGWGLVVGEAGARRTPTVAYRDAGGTTESIDHDESGLLVETRAQFTVALGELLRDQALRERLGKGAFEKSYQFTWDHAQDAFSAVLDAAIRHHRTAAVD